jgi:hypothetical protein
MDQLSPKKTVTSLYREPQDNSDSATELSLKKISQVHLKQPSHATVWVEENMEAKKRKGLGYKTVLEWFSILLLNKKDEHCSWKAEMNLKKAFTTSVT